MPILLLIYPEHSVMGWLSTDDNHTNYAEDPPIINHISRVVVIFMAGFPAAKWKFMYLSTCFFWFWQTLLNCVRHEHLDIMLNSGHAHGGWCLVGRAEFLFVFYGCYQLKTRYNLKNYFSFCCWQATDFTMICETRPERVKLTVILCY